MERTIRSLTRHYPRRDEAVVQVLTVLDRFQGVLNPEQSDFTYDDGRVELLLSLTGVLPIPIQANVYHCPIVFWLPLDYPTTPPIVFILPSETLAVRKGKNVDAGGRVNVQYLEQWSRKSEGCSLLALIEELIPIFSARYPVTTIQPKAVSRTSPPTSSQPTQASTMAAQRTASPAAQPIPPRPPLPAGSPASTMSRPGPDGSVSQPPARPPLPSQALANGRPPSLLAENPRNSMSFGIPATSHGAPPRPPPPPVTNTNGFGGPSTLPPGPPPGYHPPPRESPMPPYNVPQRSATTASFGSNDVAMPRPPAVTSTFPQNPQSPFPPQPPVSQVSGHLPLGPPIAPPQPNPPSRRYSSMPPDQPASHYSHPPPAPKLPLPGAFSPPPQPPRARPDSTYSRDFRSPPSRPDSPGASTARAYSPAPSSVAAPPSTYLSSPTRSTSQHDSRVESHYRRDSYDSQPVADPRHPPNQRFSREVGPAPLNMTSFPPSPPTQSQYARPRPPPIDPSVRAYSPAPSSAATSVPALSARPPQPPSQHRSQWSGPPSSAASTAPASEYDAEYGSYMPPALSATAVSVAGEDERRIEQARTGTERLSLDRTGARSQQPSRSSYEPYQPAPPHENRFPHPPRPPSAVFETVLESRNRQQHRPHTSLDSPQTSSYYPPPHPTPNHDPRLPPPVGSVRQNGYAPSPVSVPHQVMRSSLPRKLNPPAPTSTTSSFNILDAADEDLDNASSVAPTSPSSVSQAGGRGAGGNTPHTSQVPPPIPPNPALLALRTRLHSKLSSALTNLHQTTTTQHLEPLSLMHSDLLKAVPAIEDEMARLRAVRDVCLNVRDRYQAVVEEGEQRMGEYERRGEGVDVDEIVCGSTVVYTQLLDLVAEDAALEDTIYALGRGLNSGTANIDLDQFLKRVRALAREQFIKRATINKILLGLAIRRERSQQQQRERERERSGGGEAFGSRNGSGQGGRGTPLGG
ncbi:hypothetical protein JCM16303_003332 [Sporobolomyces ruberrimus]